TLATPVDTDKIRYGRFAGLDSSGMAVAEIIVTGLTVKHPEKPWNAGAAIASSAYTTTMVAGASGGDSWGASYDMAVLTDGAFSTFYGISGGTEMVLEYEWPDPQEVIGMKVSWMGHEANWDEGGPIFGATENYYFQYWDESASDWVTPDEWVSTLAEQTFNNIWLVSGNTYTDNYHEFYLPAGIVTTKVRFTRPAGMGDTGIGLSEWEVVTPLQDSLDDFETGDLVSAGFTTEESTLVTWAQTTTDGAYSTSSSLQCGFVGDGEYAAFEKTVYTGEAADISFWWKTDVELGVDGVAFFIDDILVAAKTGGETDMASATILVRDGYTVTRTEFTQWAADGTLAQHIYEFMLTGSEELTLLNGAMDAVNYADWKKFYHRFTGLSAGEHTLRWEYLTDPVDSAGAYSAGGVWVDEILFEHKQPILIPPIWTSEMDFEVSDFTDYELTMGGDAIWDLDTTGGAYSTQNSLHNEDTGDNEMAYVEKVVEKITSKGEIDVSFSWKVNSEDWYDFVAFFVDDELVTAISGGSFAGYVYAVTVKPGYTVTRDTWRTWVAAGDVSSHDTELAIVEDSPDFGWRQFDRTFALAPGEHTFAWEYQTDDYDNSSVGVTWETGEEGGAWLDEVVVEEVFFPASETLNWDGVFELTSGESGGWWWPDPLDAVPNPVVVCDDNTTTFYGFKGEVECHFDCEWEQPRTVEKLRAYLVAGPGGIIDPGAYYFQYWDEAASDWVTPSEWQSNVATQTFGEWHEFTLVQPIDTSKVRFVKPNVGASGGYALAEWDIVGLSELGEPEVEPHTGQDLAPSATLTETAGGVFDGGTPGSNWGASSDIAVLVDDDYSTFYGVQGNVETTIECEWTAAKDIGGIKIYFEDHEQNWDTGGEVFGATGNYYFQYWDDTASDWVTPDEWTTVLSDQTFSEWHEFYMSIPVTTTKIRYTRPVNVGATGFGISELEVIEASYVGGGTGGGTGGGVGPAQEVVLEKDLFTVSDTEDTTVIDPSIPVGYNDYQLSGDEPFRMQNEVVYGGKVPGGDGGAMSFNGYPNNYIQIADDPAFDVTDFTIGAWIYVPSLTWDGETHPIISNATYESPYQRYGLYIVNSGRLGLSVHDGSIADSSYFAGLPQVNDDQWHFVMATYSTSGLGTTAKLYVDGQLEYTDNQLNTGAISPISDLYIGRDGTGQVITTENWEGMIDEVMLFDYTLDDTEIAGIYSTGLTGAESGLIAYYSFVDGTATDNSGNGHDGVNYGATPTGIDFAVKAGAIGHDETSVIEKSFTWEEDGFLRFNWKVSSEQDHDYFTCYVNGGSYTTVSVSGEVDWTEVEIPMTAGTYSVTWEYSK
ncbi:MAG: LamG domain-containing protein, partial [Candidatus Omnitrophota bacterium]